MTAAVVLLGGLAACGGSDAGTPNTDTTTTSDTTPQVPPDLSGVSLKVKSAPPTALDLSYNYMLDVLKDWGANVDAIEVIGSLSGSQMLEADNVEVAQATADELVTNAAAGLTDLVAFGSPRASFGYVLVAKNGINSVQDLKGKVIAMSGTGGFDQLLTKMTIKNAGIDPNDVRFVELGISSNRATALLAGRVDAAMIFLETWVQLQKDASDKVHQLPSIADEQLANIPQVVLARSNWIDSHPDLAFAVACANVKMFHWMNTDEQGFIKYVQDHVEGTDATVLDNLYKQAIDKNMFPQDTGDMLNTDGMQLLADQLYELGVVDQKVDVETQTDFDKSFLQQAVDAGCANA